MQSMYEEGLTKSVLRIKPLPKSNLLFFTHFSNRTSDSTRGTHEERLINHILSQNNMYARPVKEETDTLRVEFGISLQQIIDVV